MKNSLKKLFSAFTAAFCLAGAVSFNCDSHSALKANAAIDYIDNGTADGYTYSVWNKSEIGSIAFENTENNGFTASWNSIEDFAVSKGITFEENKISAYQVSEYEVDYDIDILGNENDYISITGWFTYPKIQFNIVEAWDSRQPTGFNNSDPVATVDIDGTTYDIYRYIYENPQPSFPNSYWSVPRKEPFELGKETNIKGTVDVAAHFRAWAEAGLELGYLNCIDFSLEAYRSNGYANLNSLNTRYEVSEEQLFGPPMPVKPYTEHDPLPVGTDGRIINVDFENDNAKIGIKGEDASCEITDEHCFSGKRSMSISDSDKYGTRSFFYELDPYDLPKLTDNIQQYFETGARIYHNAGKDVQFSVSLVEYSDSDNTYDIISELGTRTCRSGQWTDITNIQFYFKHNVFHKYRIVFTPAMPVDYCIDDFYIADGNENNSGRQLFNADTRGDLNCDGVIDSLDVAVCRKAVISSLGRGIIETGGDVNGDFMSNLSDLVLLTKYVLHISDDIPLSEDGAVLYLGSNYDFDRTGQRCLEFDNNKYNNDSARTIVRKDGSLTAEWNDIDHYYCESYIDFADTNERKSCGEFDVSYSADIISSGNIDVLVRGLIYRGQKTLYFNVYEGWAEKGLFGDYDKMLETESSSELVTLNGTEYYMMTDIGSTEDSINLYRKDNPLELNKTCHLENSFNLAEVLDNWDENKENSDTVIKLGMFIISNKTTGYADFQELKFNKN